MAEPRYRVLVVASHPVQYHGPLFRRMAGCPEIELHVAYCSLRGVEASRDPEFETTVQWDLPLLEGYRWTRVPNSGSGAESFLGLRNPGLWKLIRDGNFDAVLCFLSYLRASFWITYLATRTRRTAFLFGCDQGSLQPRDGRWWKTRLKKAVWPWLYRLADHVVVSSTRAKQLIRSLGIPEERISLTPLVVNNDWWTREAAQVDRKKVRESWRAADDDFVLLFCAKLQAWKRPLDALRALAARKDSKMRLIFAGDGPLRSQLEAEAKVLGVDERVGFLGFVNQTQLPAVYRSADIMVLPSGYEPFGVVVNEAMCCGCPVVASDEVGAAADLVAPVQPEFIFPCGDIQELAAILARAAGDRTALKEVSVRGVLHMNSWSPERNVNQTVEAIGHAVSRVLSARFKRHSRVDANESSVSNVKQRST